ncbi:sigma-54-dependent transcriptional regulator [Phaeobacter gallaeciensis]|uniref:sigma-54-dependent transcriptional regulator n=1 Tax=Phaeobacter gallaeciensis TaxID=60890 RepID=UPI00237F6E33|nr:sigma-54 dependent transcriptional regulator [Phaeobacter gallaeciensis]MDE4099994.1 sigma-54 dependent transcriptional regulator [Phaeobacter gallaeciensis]MDE4108814.1 sigma-54 dependent transcriptional regulator [Phaeobacter gallaeciensis]MDE4113260.1 sigma-54 dependent transcriptional regulator [Phaeobacter gallaeciensis]MDE4117701.1 sigma-54 dependent transcriptional regulator [Phaeobacter gallaeciensis]MDE4122204.1 sigma-54 dependent transcriptional regulator [Phaeobacter gallaeciensi
MTILPTLLLVDDEEHSLAAMRMALEDDFECLTAPNADEAMRLMEENFVQAIFCDHRMPGKTGVEFLVEVRERWPETVRIIITGYTETNDMIAAINEAGIYQFLTKPWHPDQLVMAAKNAAQLFQLSREHDRLSLEMRFMGKTAENKIETRRRALREGFGFERILRSANSPMNATVDLARQVASFDVPVLLTGEPGTGKDAMARAMHYASLRSDQSYYEINCAGLPDDVFMVELLGAKKGAVAGSPGNRIGLLQKASRGTLFLNGVDTLSPQMQLILLRVATEGSFEPVGGTETLTTNTRLMAGSHSDLAGSMMQGTFRKDLFYALSATELALPPLRARMVDLEILTQHILSDLASEHSKPVKGVTNLALEFLGNYDWPGNLPELGNELTRMLILAQEPELGPELISRHILQADPSVTARPDPGEADVLAAEGTLKDRVEAIEARILRETLTRLKWNKSRAADELGLSRVGLRSKLDRYGVQQPGKSATAEEKD